MKWCKVPCNTGAWHACIKVQICGSSGGSCHYQKRAGVGFMSFCSLFRLPLYLEKLNFLCRNGKKYCTDLFPAMTMRSKMMTFCVEVWTIENNWLQNMRWWQVQFWRSLKSLSFFRSKIIEAIFPGGRVNTKVNFNYKGWKFWRWEIGDQIVWILIQNTLAPQELANGFSRFLRSRHCSLQHLNWNLEPANPFITYCLVYQYQDASLIWFLYPWRAPKCN